MNYQEIIQDVFTVSEEYHLAHCISADATMEQGIAVDFVRNFPQLKRLQINWAMYNFVGKARKVGRVFNLITKPRHWDKPTYKSLTRALEDMRDKAVEKGVAKIAMPMIGSGKDQLEWYRVRDIIEDVFEDTDIHILVCKLK